MENIKFLILFFIYKKGQSITEIHLIYDNANEFIGEAFVMFETVEDIELALGSIVKENKKIQDKHIKVYRSSQEQFQTYTCDTNTIAKVSMSIKKGKIVLLENLG